MSNIPISDGTTISSFVFDDPLFKTKNLHATISRNVKKATQSGRAKLNSWIVNFTSSSQTNQQNNNNTMGWVSSRSTIFQVVLDFNSCEDAIRFLDSKCIAYTIDNVESKTKILKKKSYTFN